MTTGVPSTTTTETTAKPVEITTSKATTEVAITTTPHTEVATGTITTSTTTVVETTIKVPVATTRRAGKTTSRPSVSTRTTGIPTTTSFETTAKPMKTTTSKVTTEVATTTKPPKEVTTGTVTTSTTAVVETTTKGPVTTTKSEGTVVTSKPSITTTTTGLPSTTTTEITAKPVETTISKATTEEEITTKLPKEVTTGAVTISSATVVETTTKVPVFTTRSVETVVTSKPSVTTTTTGVPTTTTIETTSIPVQPTASRLTTNISSQTAVVITETPKTTTFFTKPLFLNTTTSVFSPLPKQTASQSTTSIAPITQTLPGSTSLSTSVLSTITGSAETTGITSPLVLTTANLCSCLYNGTSYNPGDLVYNVTDGMGWCLIAYCNASCMVEVQFMTCPTTPIPSTAQTTLRATISTSIPYTYSVVTPTAVLDCTDESPPRKNGESWRVGICTTATCINGVVTVTATPCPTVQQPICANGRQAVKVYDNKGCCYDYECQCVCSVWGTTHYMTFDGKTFDFKENCSYYLVKEIISKYNLTITVNKQDCDYSSDGTFCSQSLTVIYQSYVVVLNQSETSGTIQNKVYVNEKHVYPSYSNDIILITSTDMEVTLEIPDIKTKVFYRGVLFSIEVPHSLFGGNTEGQCGTCDNSQTNDCRSPNGQVESCSTFAGHWQIPGKPCKPPPTTTSPPLTSSGVTYLTTQPVCKPVICDLLTSSVFEPCHKVIPPKPFITSCVSDICNGDNETCSSLEAYATMCSKAGVCIDWRNQTNGLCEHKCPAKTVYKACGPQVEKTCNDRYNKKYKADDTLSTNQGQEGCFCPSGTTLFNTVYDTCVSSCDVCVGPDGKPREPGNTWISGCNKCVCDKDSMSIQCESVQCPAEVTVNCTEPGQQVVSKTENCCTQHACECNSNLCPRPVSCQLGWTLNVTNGVCCQEYKCVSKAVCVYDMTEYKPGAKIPTTQTLSEVPLAAPPTTTLASSGTEAKELDPCQECYCGPEINPNTSLHVIVCTPIVCNTTCSEGYEYQLLPGHCCGQCVQKSCILNINNITVTIEVNKTFVSPDDKCVEYSCEKINGHLVTKGTKTTCPAFNLIDCEPGTEITDVNGCCKSCKLRSLCEVQSKQKVIEANGCKSKDPVNMTFCFGHCGSSSVYSAAVNSMLRECECCQETRTTQRQVELTCSDGSRLQHNYTIAETCACTKTDCHLGTTAKQSRRRR